MNSIQIAIDNSLEQLEKMGVIDSPLEKLAKKWKQRSGRLWEDSKNETDPAGKQALEFGARIYASHADELREVLAQIKSVASKGA
ncbi:MAG: hypothetical protein WCK93_07645 [Nitrosomonadales bacterium]